MLTVIHSMKWWRQLQDVHHGLTIETLIQGIWTNNCLYIHAEGIDQVSINLYICKVALIYIAVVNKPTHNIYTHIYIYIF